MTTITLGKYYIEVKGHSGYAEKGKDIVCAAISTLIEATYNYLIATGSKIDKKEDEALYIINTKEINEHGKQIFNEFEKMIYEIAIQYPAYIQIFKLL